MAFRWQRVAVLASAAVAGVLFASGGVAAAQPGAVVTQVGTIHVVSDDTNMDPRSFDISWVEESTGLYYLTDRTNNAVDQFDANRDKFLGFLGKGSFHSLPGDVCLAMGASDDADCRGPNGVVTDKMHRVWVTDGVNKASPISSIKVIASSESSPEPGAGITESIPTGGKFRSDELSYDPDDDMILLANPDVHDAFLTWIDATTMRVAGTFHFSPQDPEKWGGLEQSVWDPRTSLFYQAVPGVTDDSGKLVTPGEIDAFSPIPVNGVGQRVARIMVPDCVNGPAGLVRARNQTLIGACDNGGVVVKIPNGDVHKMIPNVGGADELWFNVGDGNVYFAIRGGQLGVADAESDHFLTSLPTGSGAHSVAANIGNNHIFVPVPLQGIFVFTSEQPS